MEIYWIKVHNFVFWGKNKTKKTRRAVYQFHVVCFDGNGWAWVGFSPEKNSNPIVSRNGTKQLKLQTD